jgi:2-isopropylmalate synthase
MTRIQIYDTTLRDGSQGEGVNFSLQDKLLITKKLDELGVDFIEGGYPLSNPKDCQYFQEVRKLRLQHAQVVSFGMTRRRGVAPEQDVGLKALLEAGTPVVTIVGKTWDLHVTEVLGVSLEENLRMIGESVAFLKSQGREVFYDAEHCFEGYAHNPEYALRTLQAAQDAGASMVILCDTNGGSLPDRIAHTVEHAKKALRVPIGIHCHNDCDVAVANTLTAVAWGATQVQGTINGIGERCGNVDLISVIANLALKQIPSSSSPYQGGDGGGRCLKTEAASTSPGLVGSPGSQQPSTPPTPPCQGGEKNGYDLLRPGSLRLLTEVSRYVYEIANMNFRPNQPFVGASAFAHKGGMHVHAVNKNTATYEHIDPGLVGNERRVLLSELSGQSNILAKTTKYDITHNREAMAKILNRVQDLEHAGYEFEAAEASFDLLVKKTLGLYKPWFERLGYHVTVETNSHGKTTNEATVKVRVGNEVQHTVSEGDGPVNALDGALRKALGAYYPRLAEISLVDYKVRVVNAKEGTAARVRVVIESSDDRDVWSTVGVSENIIEASWLALVDSLEYKLFKDAEASGSA